ncbi:hypothetical protein CRYUN_Cryun02cG0060000 [Craigia yunnanensis]
MPFSRNFSLLLPGIRRFFGCFTKPSLIIAVDEPSKVLAIQGQKVKRSSFSEDFWSSSACEMEHSAVLSQSGISLISISDQFLERSGSTSHPSEFVNHGLLLWNQTRQHWLGNKRSEKRAQLREPTISWNAIYDCLCTNNKPFPQPIPLPCHGRHVRASSGVIWEVFKGLRTRANRLDHQQNRDQVAGCEIGSMARIRVERSRVADRDARDSEKARKLNIWSGTRSGSFRKKTGSNSGPERFRKSWSPECSKR